MLYMIAYASLTMNVHIIGTRRLMNTSVCVGSIFHRSVKVSDISDTSVCARLLVETYVPRLDW